MFSFVSGVAMYTHLQNIFLHRESYKIILYDDVIYVLIITSY